MPLTLGEVSLGMQVSPTTIAAGCEFGWFGTVEAIAFDRETVIVRWDSGIRSQCEPKWLDLPS